MELFKKHWRAVLGGAALLPSLWRGFVWLFDWGARVDLIVTKLREYGEAAAVIEFLINPPPWFIFPAIIIGLLLIWRDVTRRQKPILVGDQENFRGIVGDRSLIRNPSDTPIESSVPPVGRVMINEQWNAELIRWSQLYEEIDSGKGLRLRFLPDTDDQASDALLLICYGYKIIKNVESISAKFANSQIEYLLQHAPNTRESPIYRFGNAIAFALSERDFGGKCVSQGTVERIGLSKGGFYRLTRWGEEKARNLARDLIERA